MPSHFTAGIGNCWCKVCAVLVQLGWGSRAEEFLFSFWLRVRQWSKQLPGAKLNVQAEATTALGSIYRIF